MEFAKVIEQLNMTVKTKAIWYPPLDKKANSLLRYMPEDSIDDSVDATIFLGENDEEEKENMKLLFDVASSDSKIQNINKSSKDSDAYTFKKYTKPHLNLIFPPPDLA